MNSIRFVFFFKCLHVRNLVGVQSEKCIVSSKKRPTNKMVTDN